MEENEKSFKTVPNPNTYKNYTTEPKQKIPAIRSKIVGEGVSNTGLNANLQNSRLC